MLGQEHLRHVLFPLGEYTKPQVRAMAAKFSLPVADKQESQDICFVRDQDYRRFLQAHASEAVRPGPILDTAGHAIGQHQGLPFYTIGQRRGLGIAWSEALYVLRLDAEHNALVVGPASQLGRQSFKVREMSYVAGHPPPFPASVTTKIRYTGSEVPAILTPGTGKSVHVTLATPLRDITPGQGAVFYQGQAVLGGGIITDSPQNASPRSMEEMEKSQ
jgi:tRNA-specific 2-thiouridylase